MRNRLHKNTGEKGDTLVHNELIHDLLDEALAEYPDSTAIRDSVGHWTYRRLAQMSHAFARWLRVQGVSPGERVLTQLPSRRELCAMLYGASRAGVVLVPLNPAMKEFHLTSVLANAEPALVVAPSAAVDTLAGLTGVPVHAVEDVWLEVERLTGDTEVPLDPGIGPDDIAALVYTSGSTAAPKAVVCPHRQMAFASRSINAVLGYRPDDVVFCRFPLSWDYGLYKILLACLGRSELVLAGEESDLVLLRRMRETGATIVPIVPSLATMIATLASRDDGPPAPVRMFTNTGAALPETTIAMLREAFPGVRVVRQFGQTECKRISIMPVDEDTERPGSVGKPLPGTVVLLLDQDGNPVPQGEAGEIVAVGPHVMPGYWRAPEISVHTFQRDARTGERRLHTGDYGSFDADGYLYFHGRRDDMFKRKGIRMSTIEIEAAAMDIPGVRAAAVLPPSEGRDLVVFVESDLAGHVVLKELATRLEPAKVPAACRVVDELPLTQHGKNARQVLAALFGRPGE
ncbi:AMP-binding protein [Kitasatospora sp. NPDC086801]|uniref:AMP-binding protein n=1 Tax=Kitasatospora sp. NPDC086801 TaxID=3364066 RepID=UPI00381EC76D